MDFANEYVDPALIERLLPWRADVAVVSLTALWTWESLWPFFALRASRRRHAACNLALALLNVVVIGLVFGTATFAVTRIAASHDLGLLRIADIPALARFALALLMLDAWMYLWHRANHRVPLLWRFHRTHHSDDAVDVTSATRFHTGEQAAAAVLRLMLIPLVGWDLLHLVVYDTLLLVATQLHHANISLGRWERPLAWVFVTPQMHKVHHSRVKIETDSNYSVVLSIWDRLGRSFRWRDDAERIEFGLDQYNDPDWQTVTGMLKTPFVDAEQEDA
jgi:sterol desaturase/sphingolipid hydroxylase (fatty acid hydroxylase superfamily)